MRYGIPYMGSKNRLADKLLEVLPSSNTFVDLFAGGCAMSHAASLSGKYKHIIVNDIEKDPIHLFQSAIDGSLQNNIRPISRQDFFKYKDEDPYVKYCWSFGNQGNGYLWGQQNEQAELLACKMLLSDSWQERRKYYMQFCKMLDKVTALNRPYEIEALARTENLLGLSSLSKHTSFTFLNKDYRDVQIPENSTVYCDIPYKDTRGYSTQFNYDDFYQWALSRPFTVYISSYSMPEDFKIVGQWQFRNTMNDKVNKLVTQKLFTNQN